MNGINTTFSIPYPPYSGNHQHGAFGQRRYMRPEMLAWRDSVVYAMRSAGVFCPASQGRVAVVALVSPPDRRARDLGNVEKVVSDALQAAGLFVRGDVDEDAIVYLRAVPVKSGSIRIIVRPRRAEEYDEDLARKVAAIL